MRFAISFLAFISLAGAQHGMTGLSSNPHPRIYWNVGSRLTNAQAYYALHPWTPGADTIDNAGLRAAYSRIAGDASACTVAHDRVMAYTIATHYLANDAGAATDGGSDKMRYYGDIVAEVWDWCQSDFSPSDTRLLLDRWIGTTSGDFDPIHAVTDGVINASSYALTSASNPFLANMALNNMVEFTSGGGVHCPPVHTASSAETLFGIDSVDSAGQVTLNNFSGFPTTVNATGCHFRVIGYVTITDGKVWGDANMPYSNYSGAYTRNDFLFGIAAYDKHNYAPTLVDSWETRHTQALAYQAGTGAFTGSSGKGGFVPEGIEYGIQNWWYKFMPLIVAADYGRNLVSESTWYRESLLFTLYNALLGPTYDQVGTTYTQFFPWDDQQAGGVDPDAPGYPQGSFAQTAINELSNILGSINIAKYGRQFVNTISGSGIMPQPWLVDPLSSTLSLSGLPLDFCVSGTGTCIFKNSWSSTGTQFKTTAATDLSGHMHFAAGDWWLASNGYRMSAGFSNYADSGGTLSSLNCTGSGYDPGVACDVRSSIAHNTVAFGTSTAPSPCAIGMYSQGTARGYASEAPNVLRLESKANYSYIAEDLSLDFFNAELFDTSRACIYNNPYQKSTIREKIFVKTLPLLILLERLESQYAPTGVDTSHLAQTAAQVLKVVYVHAPVAATIAGNVATWNNNSVQRMKLWAFTSESGITLNDVDTGDFTGHQSYPYPHRLEISANGHAITYMITVIRTAPISGWVDPTSVAYDNSTRTLTYQSAAGNVTFSFGAGAQPNGEMIGYSASSTPTLAAMTSSVGYPTVDNSGPIWPGTSASGTVVVGQGSYTGKRN